MTLRNIIVLAALLFCACKKEQSPADKTPATRLLVLTETQGYRHESIPAGLAMLRAHEAEWNIDITEATESHVFTLVNLRKYRIVVLLNTTGDLFSNEERAALQEFMRSGGSILGIHAAADAEYSWPWYGQMLGAWFSSHPPVQEAVCHVVGQHVSTAHISDEWRRTDEWYNFKSVQVDNHVVLTVDEQSYTGGTHGATHPISWYRQFEGGKIFYTGMGHTPETYGEPLFIEHLKGAVDWLRE